MSGKTSYSDLIALYEKMDHAWNKAAGEYPFQCNGCKENCCETLFYHHTHLERAFLRSGFKGLPAAQKKQIKTRAKEFVKKTASLHIKEDTLRTMCPVNEDGKCALYRFRPMICRLHGIPHELKKPGAPLIKNPGCEAGAPVFKNAYHPFDRTPFYHEMAALETRYARTHGKFNRIRQTVAEMIVS